MVPVMPLASYPNALRTLAEPSEEPPDSLRMNPPPFQFGAQVEREFRGSGSGCILRGDPGVNSVHQPMWHPVVFQQPQGFVPPSIGGASQPFRTLGSNNLINSPFWDCQ